MAGAPQCASVAGSRVDRHRIARKIGPRDNWPRQYEKRVKTVSEQIKVAVIGAQGRMGQAVCAAVEQAPDMTLVAQLDQGDTLDRGHLNGATHAVDFTHPAVTEDNVHVLLDLGVHPVVGTTGWSEEALQRVRQHCEKTSVSALIAPNFAISAVLSMHFAAQAARFFESVEVIEMHHPGKVDAPSGTAVKTAQAISAARAAAGLGDVPDATETDPAGARGAKIEGIPVHAVRLRGLTAHEEILLGNPGEQMVIRSDCFDRVSFMPGVLLALRNVADKAGLTWGLDQIMNLS